MTNIMPKRIATIVYGNLMGCMNDLADGDEILADDNWNDPDVLYDMLGDRINDHLCEFNLRGKVLHQAKIDVTEELKLQGHIALEEACKMYLNHLKGRCI